MGDVVHPLFGTKPREAAGADLPIRSILNRALDTLEKAAGKEEAMTWLNLAVERLKRDIDAEG